MANTYTRRYPPAQEAPVYTPKHMPPRAPQPTPTPPPAPPTPPPAPPPKPPAPPSPTPPMATSGWPNGVYIKGGGGLDEVWSRIKTMGRYVTVYCGGGRSSQGFCITGRFIDPGGVEHLPTINADRCTSIVPGTSQQFSYYLTAQVIGNWTFVATVTGAGGAVLDTKSYPIKVY